MGANSAAGSLGGGGTKAQAQRYSTKNELSSAVKKAGEFVASGGITGTIIRGITQGIKKSKQNVLDYEGQAAGVTPERKPFNNPKNDGGNDNNNQPTIKSVEQPKVKSQMDNTDVKSDLITADKTAPTEAETTESADDILLKNKKKGRKKTILTSVTGVDDYPTLSKKTLLGG